MVNAKRLSAEQRMKVVVLAEQGKSTALSLKTWELIVRLSIPLSKSIRRLVVLLIYLEGDESKQQQRGKIDSLFECRFVIVG